MVIMWFIAFILTVVVLGSGNAFQMEALRQGPASVHTQRVQVFLTLYETLVVGAMAVTGHAIVRKEGPDPEGWRNLESGEVCGASLCYIIEHRADRLSGCRCCIGRTSDDGGYYEMIYD